MVQGGVSGLRPSDNISLYAELALVSGGLYRYSAVHWLWQCSTVQWGWGVGAQSSRTETTAGSGQRGAAMTCRALGNAQWACQALWHGVIVTNIAKGSGHAMHWACHALAMPCTGHARHCPCHVLGMPDAVHAMH